MPGRPFQPGVSPNPGGQRRVTKEARNLAADATPGNMTKLIELRDTSEDEYVVLEAVKQLNAYGLGKPVAHVQKTVTHVKRSPREMTLEELQRALATPDTDGSAETH